MSRFARRWLWVGVACLVVCVGLWFYAIRRAEEVIGRHAREARAGLQALEGRVIRRSPLVPWPAGRDPAQRPTDARPLYVAALGRALAIPEAEQEILPENRYENLDTIDEEAVHAFVVKYRAVIDDLLPVLHADRITVGTRVTEGLEATVADVPGWQALNSLIQGAVRNGLVRGEDQAVAPWVLLHLCAGQDCAHGGSVISHLVGMGIGTTTREHARLLLARGALDAETLATWAGALDALAAHRPRLADAWAVEEALVRWEIAQAAREDDTSILGDDSGLIGWRHLWSVKLWAAEGLDLLPDAYARLRAIPERPLRAAAEEAQRVLDAEPEDGNGLVRAALAPASIVYRGLALFEMRMHLLRVGVALAQFRAAHGAWPRALADLVPAFLPALEPCPLAGTPLGYADGKLWSWGPDGDDDGGRALEEDDWDADGDAVFDLNDTTLPDPFAWSR